MGTLALTVPSAARRGLDPIPADRVEFGDTRTSKYDGSSSDTVADREFSAAEMASIASSVLKRTLRVRAGETLTIETWAHGAPWADVFATEARHLRASPVILYESEAAFWEALRRGSGRALGAIGRNELALLESTDAYVFLPGPRSRPKSVPEAHLFYQIQNQWDDQWYRAAQRSGLRACRLEIADVSPDLATQYGIDVNEWRREISEGSRVDPATFKRAARRATRLLERGRRVTVTHPNGTRLDLGLRGRPPVLEDAAIDEADLRAGRMMTVVPTGALMVALDERIADGTFFANRPSRHRRGTFDRARWSFVKGRLTDFDIGIGADIFEDSYSQAGKGRDRPSLLEIGLNPKIRNSPFFEDYAQGVVTMYIGRNVDFGGTNRGEYREYALLEGATVTVDGRPVLRDGDLL